MSEPLTVNFPPDSSLSQARAPRHHRHKASSVAAKPATWRRALPLLWLLPFALLFGLFQLAPMIWVMVNAFQVDGHWSLANFKEIIDSPFYLQSFTNSIDLALWSSLLGLLIALAGTAALRQVPGKLQDMVVAFTTMASNFSGVPLAFAFIVLLGMNGALTLLLQEAGIVESFNLYSRSGLIVLYTYFQIPLAILLLYPAFDGLQEDWRDAAALLGARPWQYWLRVVLPVLTPALLGTFIILLANALGAYASTFALMTSNYNLVTIQISALVAGDIFLEPQLAAALSLLLMIILLLVTAVNQWIISRSRYE
ncbi:ABC transporter permease [Oceanisphaera profunda]|uniref:ABC transporter permease n=1 Tax=Oceanisphaera profunda TaxID=1416627 RepID=A0A1Y0D7S4_9GAMM|nr:ABC transporter permease subunit [Oceanisphaera profunda]ART83611.1 ABC transporter permease [Oceanisphaera profunda]